MSKQELIAKAERMTELMNDEDMDGDEAKEEVGLVTISPPDEYAAYCKRQEVKANASGKKATLDDDGNIVREPTDEHKTLWEDDE